MRKFKVGISGKLPVENPGSCTFESLKLLPVRHRDERAENSFIMGLKGNIKLK